MRIKFYGTRGSTPVSGREYVKYGGSTTCIAIDMEDKLLLVDCGTGLQLLQKEKFNNGCYKEADIFISHIHWDHIQGIAFFGPFFSPDFSFRIYSEERYGTTIQQQIEGIMHSPMFPVEAEAFLADIQYRTIKCGDRIRLKGVTVDTIRLDHPNICTGYRFCCNGTTVCILADCENLEEDLAVFARGADLLVCDAQYTEEEYSHKIGWGHAAWQDACAFAKKCGVNRLVLTHHDPQHTDADLDKIQKQASETYPQALLAYDGMEVIL